jgi:hypothetical protein
MMELRNLSAVLWEMFSVTLIMTMDKKRTAH